MSNFPPVCKSFPTGRDSRPCSGTRAGEGRLFPEPGIPRFPGTELLSGVPPSFNCASGPAVITRVIKRGGFSPAASAKVTLGPQILLFWGFLGALGELGMAALRQKGGSGTEFINTGDLQRDSSIKVGVGPLSPELLQAGAPEHPSCSFISKSPSAPANDSDWF